MLEEAYRVLIASGEKERLKELLRTRLMECGWKDQMQMFCREVVREKGVNIRVDDIMAEVTPRARAAVPDTVKKELLQNIKSHLSKDL